ncbi:MAG: site-specific DNA-methyltransferase [Chloroflexi bacterium]|nr:site-specific DNA-methyltransferase [Chloroflexota bacterium]
MTVRILVGDCRKRLEEIASESISLVVTSPPFYGLRSYSVKPTVWGGAGDCRHVWGDELPSRPGAGNHPDRPSGFQQKSQAGQSGALAQMKVATTSGGAFCQHCNAWRGTLGNEPSIDLYVSNLVGIFQQVRRVLTKTGCCLINLGDSYSTQGGSNANPNRQINTGQRQAVDGGSVPDKSRSGVVGLKIKDLCGIPWRVALALQADGWWLRSEIPWIKRNPMPGSQTDRPTTAHEHIFLLAKSKMYYWDGEAIKKSVASGTMERANRGVGASHKLVDGTPKQTAQSLNRPRSHGDGYKNIDPSGRTYRTSDPWFQSLDARITQQRECLAHLEHIRANGGLLLDEAGDPLALQVNTKGFSGSHFAVFPPDLVKPFVKAGSSERGVCGECGGAWVRVVDREFVGDNLGKRPDNPRAGIRGSGLARAPKTVAKKQYLGWRPTCPHYPRTDEWRKVPRQGKDEDDADYEARIAPIVALRAELLALWEPMEAEPATVLDPFGGAGTVGLVADRERRHAILCELSAEYATMARDRIAGDAGPLFADVRVE